MLPDFPQGAQSMTEIQEAAAISKESGALHLTRRGAQADSERRSRFRAQMVHPTGS